MAEIERDKTLDGLKFLLISLVIIGHAIEPSRYLDICSGALYSVIYSFHMPLFVMLSGYFSKNLSLQKIDQQSLSLVETYLVMAISMGLLLGSGLKLVVFPSLSCWYILSLIYWRYMLYWLVVKKKLQTKSLLVCSLLIMLITFFLPIKHYLGFLTLMRTCQFFPFFVIGYCLSERIIWQLRNIAYCKWILNILTAVFLFFVIIYSSRQLHVLEFHRDTIFSIEDQFEWSFPQTLIYKSLVILVSLIISFSLITIGHFSTIFEKYGRYTLSFFFLQGIIVHKIVMVLPANLFLELLVSIAVIILGGAICDKLSWVMNPISTYVKRK